MDVHAPNLCILIDVMLLLFVIMAIHSYQTNPELYLADSHVEERDKPESEREGVTCLVEINAAGIFVDQVEAGSVENAMNTLEALSDQDARIELLASSGATLEHYFQMRLMLQSSGIDYQEKVSPF